MEQAEGLERQVDQINHEIYVKVSIINLEKWEDSVELHRQEGSTKVLAHTWVNSEAERA